MYVRPTSTRLFRGTLTPAMRAIRSSLSLPLLVARVLANHEDGAVATDDLALLAHRLDRRSYLHDPFQAVFGPGGAALTAARAVDAASRLARTQGHAQRDV